ncbi:MAG TPA: hypothetical protein G4O07_01225 [Dehalococcoidia bacterium]|nr:hypothetical protein [Dehalococcoidia bacterium]
MIHEFGVLSKAIEEGDDKAAVALVKEALDAGALPADILNTGLVKCDFLLSPARA